MAQALPAATELRRRLRPLGARLRRNDTLAFITRTLWMALLGAALVQLAGRAVPIPNLLIWSLVPLAGWVLMVVGFFISRPLGPERVARRVDSALELRERLSTALELGNAGEQPLTAEQQDDARAIAATLRPQMLRAQVDRRPLLWALAPLALFAALLVLPNPQTQVLQERAAVQQSISETIAQVQQLEQQIADDTTLSSEEREQLAQQLAALEQKLRANDGSREQALADLSTAEQQLQSRLDPGADARKAAIEQLSRNLQTLSGQQPAPRTDAAQTAQQLRDLASQLSQMTPEQQQQMAQQLQQQAQQMGQADQQMAERLSQAAQALQQGNAAQAQQSLDQAAQRADQVAQQQADQNAVERALSQLQQNRQTVAQSGQQQQQQAQQGQQGQQQQGQQGQQQQGQQGQQQQGQQGQGQGEGQQGENASGGGGDAQNAQGGQSANQGGEGQGGSGSVDPNRPDGGGGAGDEDSGLVYQPYDPRSAQGNQEQIQGQQGQGGQSQVQQGQAPLPGVANSAQVPYEDVLPQYEQAAGEALDQSAIPPHLKDYVRDYFTQLEPQR